MTQLNSMATEGNSTCNTMCYNNSRSMATSTTVSTSVRLPKELSRELARKARSTKRGKNWVIKEALELYLLGSAHDALRAEARKQSILASRHASKDEAAWLKPAAEIEDWRA